jgi:hypothetical protein
LSLEVDASTSETSAPPVAAIFHCLLQAFETMHGALSDRVQKDRSDGPDLSSFNVVEWESGKHFSINAWHKRGYVAIQLVRSHIGIHYILEFRLRHVSVSSGSLSTGVRLLMNTEIEGGPWVQGVVFSHPFSYFRYPSEIRNAIAELMTRTPDYWSKYGALPETLEI